MDGMKVLRQAGEFLKKYRYVAIVLAVGLFLMLLPETEAEIEVENELPTETAAPAGIQESLEDILSCVDGAGKVRILLTQLEGELTVYQTDENSSSDSLRTETVILSDSQRGQTGLIRQVNPPVYQGAVVLCQGADSAAVRLAITEAVAAATGLTADKITVLKMK